MEDQNGNEKSRLDRMEGMLEIIIADHVTFGDEHKKLLTAQVVLTGKMQQLTDSQKHTDENLGVLIRMMDELIRDRGNQPPA